MTVDCITQLPESQGQTQIMVVSDHCTKMARFIGLATNATPKDVADTCLKEVWKLIRLPSENISDMEAKFAAKPWQLLSKT